MIHMEVKNIYNINIIKRIIQYNTSDERGINIISLKYYIKKSIKLVDNIL